MNFWSRRRRPQAAKKHPRRVLTLEGLEQRIVANGSDWWSMLPTGGSDHRAVDGAGLQPPLPITFSLPGSGGGRDQPPRYVKHVIRRVPVSLGSLPGSGGGGDLPPRYVEHFVWLTAWPTLDSGRQL